MSKRMVANLGPMNPLAQLTPRMNPEPEVRLVTAGCRIRQVRTIPRFLSEGAIAGDPDHR
jgi:hypothetical protein